MKGIIHYDEDIAKFKRGDDGVWREADPGLIRFFPDGSSIEMLGASCSDKGMRQLHELRRIQRHWQPLLDAWHQHYGHYLCRHGVPLDEFSWTINDYCYDDASEPAAWQEQTVFMLDDGFHGDDYCIVAEFTPRLLTFTWFPWGDEYVPQPAPELTP